jgi:gamma-glutamylcyclotransferase (GGCT)/AIG2-like uncharacterized protein YtfP
MPASMSQALRVFVYGTLKPGERWYAVYCEGKVSRAEAAIVQGQLYDLPLGYPAMTKGEGWVQGVLLTFGGDVDSQQEILAELDDLEDYHPQGSLLENEYERSWIPVFNPAHQSLGYAWAYVMESQRVQERQGTILQSGFWNELTPLKL